MLLLFLFLVVAEAAAQSSSSSDTSSPVGQWLTIDDEFNAPRSLVTIYEEDGVLYARVDSIYQQPDEPEDPVCEKCEGERKDKRVLGMTIMWGMERKGDAWSGGHILDPKKGKIYRCKIWVDGDNLRVRGYLGPFYRTQTWLPADSM